MYDLQKMLESTMLEMLEDNNSDNADIDRLVAKISNPTPSLVEETARSMLAKIKRDAFSGGLEYARTERRQFEERLMKLWKKPIDLLELFISLAVKAGSDFNSEFRNESVSSGDAVFEALTRLHGRACQVANEVLVLLRSGYADGAHARWRTLHEIAVIGLCISKPKKDEHKQELAKKYLLHDTIQRYKLASQYQKHAKRLGQEPIPQEEFDNLKAERDALITRFGKSYKEDNGWAVSVTGTKRPSLSDLEECVGLEYWRPYYRMASDNVHPNAHGTYYRLGLTSHSNDVILTGPSDMGLADPGHSTAISLHQITKTLLATKLSFNCLVVSNILEVLVDEIGESFLEAHNYVEMLSHDENETESAT